ncbi:MAG TPA: DNA-3-methyladenine glycosylase [Anaeromyxobacteraceae bacterium]|nr:DNA-3-methyladenine glycosylase [Anaeromyxobacteraceae bacterium]
MAGAGPGAKLPRAFYARDARTVARALLGQVLVHEDHGVRRAVRIVETEAYLGEKDRASHARFGRTPRAAIMFGPAGFSYVYLVYGLAHCFNVVTGPDGEASAVLIRAGEPLEGCLHATSGPGNLCRALGLRRETHNGEDLTGDRLFLAEGPPRRERVVSSPRVNVGYAGPWAGRLLRYTLLGNPFVSRPRPAVGVRGRRAEGRPRRGGSRP